MQWLARISQVVPTCALIAIAAPAVAVTAAECDRTTHINHGGETGQRDLGEGRVAYAEWWSQEGIFTDLIVMNCASGEFFETRVREQWVSNRYFDRTDEAVRVIEREIAAAPALFSFERLARAMKGMGRDTVIETATHESCACAAFYPDMRGAKAPFVLG